MANWWEQIGGEVDWPILPSRQTVPNSAGLPSGGVSGSNLKTSGVDWSKVAGLGAGLATSALAGGGADTSKSIRGVQRGAQEQLAQGKQLAGLGADALRPVMDYFKALASGDPNAALAATQPQRARVIDQYNSSQRAAGQFTPRGGGQASTQQESRAREASDLASVTNTARENAATTLGNLGLSEQQTGLSMEQAAQQALAQALGPLLQQQGQDTASTIQTYAGIAAMIAAFL